MNKKVLNYVMLALCIIGIGANLVSILNMTMPLFAKIPLVLAILSFVTALKYYRGHFKKDVAIHYYEYLNSLTNMLLASTTVSAIRNTGFASGVLVFAGILQYGSILLLLESRDLGRNKSMRYAMIAACLAIVTFAANFFINPTIFTAVSNIGFMLLGLIIYTMTYAKYEDKKERQRNLEIHADQELLKNKKKKKKGGK